MSLRGLVVLCEMALIQDLKTGTLHEKTNSRIISVTYSRYR